MTRKRPPLASSRITPRITRLRRQAFQQYFQPTEPSAGERIAAFLRKFVFRLLLLALVLGGIALFTLIFYPETVPLFAGAFYFLWQLKLGPILILALLLSCLPRRSRR